MTYRISFMALAVASFLSACGGAGGDAGGEDPIDTNPTVGGTDTATIESQLGIQADTTVAMRGGTTNGGATTGTVRLDSVAASIVASAGGLTTPVGPKQSTTVMNGQVSRDTSGSTVVYVPRPGSDMHVGMATFDNGGYNAMVGVFGTETQAGAMGTRAVAGGTATYSGVAEYNRDIGAQVANYRGAISATANFDNATLGYGTNAMTLESNTGGANSMSLSGTGSFNGNGTITGSFTTQSTDGNQNGTTSGAFYGPTGQNLGLIFIAPDSAGAAILNENN